MRCFAASIEMTPIRARGRIFICKFQGDSAPKSDGAECMCRCAPYVHARLSQGHVARALSHTQMYNVELRNSLLRDEGAAYRRGLQRGFIGAGLVPEAEHATFLGILDRPTVIAYRDGLLCGENLRTCRSLPMPAS